MKFLEKKIFRSLTDEEKVTKREMLLGYLLGPSLSYLTTTSIAGHYLIQFYTDVIGVNGQIVVLMPIISKFLASIANIFIGRMIDRTVSPQGKARPWILMSGPLLALSGILLYAVPQASYEVQILWLIFSYNFFFVGANNFYTLSHTLMLPRSTGNTGIRDKLSLFKNVSEAMIPGTLSAVIMPFLITRFGVGRLAQNNWFRFMMILSILAIPGTLMEYYFTRERVDSNSREDKSGRSFSVQLKDCLNDKSWMILVLLFIIKSVEGQLANGSMIYYSNWVLANSVSEGASKQAILNVVGQFPMGPGILLLMPLVKKFGKLNLMKYGYLVAFICSIIMFVCRENLWIVVGALFLKSFGALPAYLSMSLLSDIIDRFEKKYGYRCDTLSVTITTIMMTVASGLAQSILLLGIKAFGYIAPESANQVIVQNEAVRLFFSFLMSGVNVIGFGLSIILVNKLIRYTKESDKQEA